ncbi:cytidylyltransferase domain-containing protein [Desulfobacterota bacterium M19]
MKQRILGLIPAKGSSTRLPRKNIMPLGGKPLISWAGEALKNSGICDRIVVSTEDKEVASVARDEGLEVPFLRPAKLAVDPAGVVDVALHCLATLRHLGDTYDTLIITLPTCPFRTAQDIRNAYNLFRERNANFLMGVSSFDHTPFAAMQLQDGTVKPWFPNYFGRKSQEMPAAYRPNGALNILAIKEFEEARSYFETPLYAYIMPWPRGIDIDTPDDLTMAEAVLASKLTSMPIHPGKTID